MKGHTEIFQARMLGLAPPSITLTDDARQWQAQQAFEDRHNIARAPIVLIERYDTPRTADLRILYGLNVRVEIIQASVARCEQWVDACIAAGAATVVGYCANVQFLRLYNRAKNVDVRDHKQHAAALMG